MLLGMSLLVLLRLARLRRRGLLVLLLLMLRWAGVWVLLLLLARLRRCLVLKLLLLRRMDLRLLLMLPGWLGVRPLSVLLLLVVMARLMVA